MALKKLDMPAQALYSTVGHTAARTLETKILADAMQDWHDQFVANIKAGDFKAFNETKWEHSAQPSHAQRVGITEMPRGALANWIVP